MCLRLEFIFQKILLCTIRETSIGYPRSTVKIGPDVARRNLCLNSLIAWNPNKTEDYVSCVQESINLLFLRDSPEKKEERLSPSLAPEGAFHRPTISNWLSVVDVVIYITSVSQQSVSTRYWGHPILSSSQDEDGSRFQFFISGKFLDLINSHFFVY